MIESVKCTTTSWALLAKYFTHRVVGEYSIPKLLEAEEDVAQRRMRCEQLDLPRTVKQDIVICDYSASLLLIHCCGVRTSELFQPFL